MIAARNDFKAYLIVRSEERRQAQILFFLYFAMTGMHALHMLVGPVDHHADRDDGPRRVSSVRKETTRSVPPYWMGGTLSISGDT